MTLMSPYKITAAVTTLREGGIIAYPTESVYGFGCDPFNQAAVFKLFAVKKRDPKKGVILVASTFEHIESLIAPLTPQLLAPILATWPGPFTWAFPASAAVPGWIRGDYSTVALRVSAHPIVRQLCDEFAGPIVSTSANFEGELPKRDYQSTKTTFAHLLDDILDGPVGTLAQPTTIRDAMTGDTLRGKK